MTYLGITGYGAVATLYAVVGILSLISWRGGRIGGLFIVACSATAIWACLHSIHMAGGTIPQIALFCAEVLRGGLWITFLIQLVVHLGTSRYLSTAFQLVWVALLLAGVTTWAVPAAIGFRDLMFPGGMIIAVVGLLLIDQLFRNSRPQMRGNIGPLALGLGGMFAYDLYLYAHGALFGSINELVWSARGVVNTMFVPLIAIAARRNSKWDLDIFVSRHVVYYASTLVAVGAYLLLMSAGGYLIMRYAGDWGGLAQIVFFAGAVLLLFVLLFSQHLRARLKVFLSKHFFRNKYDYRDEWLRLTSTLSGFEDSSTRQIVIKAIAQIISSPGGVLWNLDETSREYKPVSAYGSDLALSGVIPLDHPMIGFIKERNWLVDLEEYRESPATYEHTEMPEWLVNDSDAWLIVPLVTRNHLTGLVMLRKSPRPQRLNYEDRDLLKTAGHQIAVHLAQESSDNLLAQSKQFEAYNRLTAFLMHDLNNLIAQQSMIVKNAERHKRSPEFVDDAMLTISSSVLRMRSIMDQLKQRDVNAKATKTVLKFIISAAVDRCAGKAPEPEMDLRGADLLIEIDAERFAMVLTHLIRNAQDATPPNGSVKISADCPGSDVCVRVADNGSGMTPDFVRDHLFRPFDSTKGSQGMGIGAYQAREFARGLGGDLKVSSSRGMGTTVVMSFPKSAVGAG
jgi:putative PEP-CTERM system histidine kinase